MNDQSSSRTAAPNSGADLPYTGDVDVARAWEMLNDPKVMLVDVRTKAEWSYVGIPDLEGLGKKVMLVEWQSYPDMARNPTFVTDLEAAGAARDATVLFLCRSGARSASAAALATKAGFAACYNVSGGFEGPHDASQHRGSTDGWKARGLPWIQG